MVLREEAEQRAAERLMRTIKEGEVDLTAYEDYTDALQQLGPFLDEVYEYKCIHSSLGYLTPAEFEDWSRRFTRNRSKSVQPCGFTSTLDGETIH